MEPLSPKNDFVFKKLFADPRHIDILAAFLASILGISLEELEGLQLMDSHIRGDTQEDKECILDIRVTTRKGVVIDVEIQLRPMPNLRKRILFYCDRMLTEQVKAGDDYKSIRKVVCIVITDHDLITEDPERCHHRFRMYDQNARVEFTDMQEIHILELTKLRKMPDDDPLRNWLFFLDAETEEEFVMAAQKDAVVDKAWTVLKELSADERTRMQAEAREKWRRDYNARMEGAHAEGRAEGEAIGMVKGEAIGIAKGEAIGIMKGEAIGIMKGKVEGEIQGILRVLTARFHAVPDDIRQAVESKTDLSALGSLLIYAATCDTLDDFRQRLR
jgi:predicted transposase/invertase (TIGR01784 family)